NAPTRAIVSWLNDPELTRTILRYKLFRSRLPTSPLAAEKQLPQYAGLRNKNRTAEAEHQVQPNGTHSAGPQSAQPQARQPRSRPPLDRRRPPPVYAPARRQSRYARGFRMLFLTSWFALFACVVFPCYWLIRYPPLRRVLLLAFSVVFHTHFAGPAGVLPIVVLGLMT